MTQMSGIAGDIEAVIGLELAVKLLRACGGTEISIPVRAKDTQLAKIIGVAACEKLARDYGTGKVALPLAGQRGRDAVQRQSKAQALDLLKAGAPVRAVALKCNLGERTVWKYKLESKDERQGTLDL